MKLQAPSFLYEEDLLLLDQAQLVPEATLENAVLKDVDGSNLRAANLNFDESILDKVVLAEARLEKLGLRDSYLKHCDLSAAKCAEASLLRVQISDSRLTGTDLSNAVLQDVVFKNCKLDMANLRFAKFKRVQFVDCNLGEADFGSAELHEISFQGSVLDKTEFGNCKITKDVDMRTSQLLDIRGWEYLRGITIDTLQLTAIAPQLALALGLKIED